MYQKDQCHIFEYCPRCGDRSISYFGNKNKCNECEYIWLYKEPRKPPKGKIRVPKPKRTKLPDTRMSKDEIRDILNKNKILFEKYSRKIEKLYVKKEIHNILLDNRVFAWKSISICGNIIKVDREDLLNEMRRINAFIEYYIICRSSNRESIECAEVLLSRKS